MSRLLLIKIHLYLASILTPVLIIMAVSGGLYLLGIKGNVESKVVYTGDISEFNVKASDLKSEYEQFLLKQNIHFSFDYVKKAGNNYFTRPTSKEHYILQVKNQSGKKNIELIHRQPDLVKSLIELHKGHGPSLFKTFQKVVAVGLLVVLITGFLLGLTSPKLKKLTIILSTVGTLLFLLLALF